MVYPGSCVGNKPMQRPRKGCKFKSHTPVECDHHSRILVATTGYQIPTIHHNCYRNQLVAVSNRVIGGAASEGIGLMPMMTLKGEQRQAAALELIASEIIAQVGYPDRYSYVWFRHYYSGRKLVRNERGWQNIQAHGLNRTHARVEAHIKKERVYPTVKANPDPRVIQARTPEYNVALGRYTKPIEHALYSWKCSLTVTGTRCIAKGLNPWQRARLARDKWEAFEKPAAISFDGARFDKHVSLKQLRLEHDFYKLLFPDDDELETLLSWQERNEVRFLSTGVRYVCKGGRMSGDMNTALGNCIIMCSMMIAFCRNLNIKFDMLDDGDDILLFVEAATVDRIIRAAPRFFRSMGHEIKVEKVSKRFETIQFCQCSPILTSIGWNMVRNPRKVVASVLTGWNEAFTAPLRYFRTKLQAELHLNRGVPVIQPLVATLLANLPYAELLPCIDLTNRLRGEKWTESKSAQISVEARVTFEEAFDWPVSAQLAMETTPFELPSLDDVLVQPPIMVDGAVTIPPVVCPSWGQLEF